MKKLLLIVMLWFPVKTMLAQEDTAFMPPAKIEGEIVDFTIDNLGNIYTLDKNNQIRKLNQKGDSIGVFNDVRRYGKVYSIDATNPLKVLVFYKDFGTILVLDRFLNVRNTIDIRKKGIFQAKAIALAYDNGIWIYDELEAKLKRLADDGSVLDQTADFRQSMETAPDPVKIIDQDRLVYLYDTAQGVFVFDYYGSLKNKISLSGWQDFQVIGDNIFGRKGAVFMRYQLKTLNLKEQEMGEELIGAERVRISVNYLYSLKNGVISIYKL